MPTTAAANERVDSFRPSLVKVLRSYPGPLKSLLPENHLELLEAHRRESGSTAFSSGMSFLAVNDAVSSSSLTSSTPPLSPAGSYASLYPMAPHLTPHPSPTHSPRSMSPDLYKDTPLPSTHVLGKLSVKVVEARGLRVDESRIAKPYVLLQYDRTDSVSREYGAPPPTQKLPTDAVKKPNGIKRGLNAKNGGCSANGSTTFRRVGGGLLRRTTSDITTTTLGNQQPPPVSSTAHSSGTTRVVTDAPPVGDPSEIGTPSSPIWNHSATFDVVAPGRTILLCVYDKLAPSGSTSGFLGAGLFEPPLSAELGEDGLGLDIWMPLTCALDIDVRGEVRIRIQFEALHSRPKMCVDDFQVLKRIGQGSFGQVFRVRKRDTKRIYAMKVISKENVRSPSALAQVQAERQVLARTNDCPFLVGLKFSFQSPTDLFFVIDYKSGGELFTHLQRDGGRFEESKVQFYIAEIVLALGYLHDCHIIYRDLKPENCLLDGSGHVILCDFGLSKLLSNREETTRTLCGTTAFTAPEVLLDEGYSWTCDYWSLGVLLFEMCYGWSPFYAESQVEEYERILNADIKIPTKKDYSAECRDLQSRLLTREPKDRIGSNGGTAELQAHPFFRTIDWTRLAARQVSPPWKPPTHADEDACDYHDMGRSGEWMFSGDGRCWQAPSRRNSRDDGRREDEDSGSLFRDFTYIRHEHAHANGHHKRRSSYSGSKW